MDPLIGMIRRCLQVQVRQEETRRASSRAFGLAAGLSLLCATAAVAQTAEPGGESAAAADAAASLFSTKCAGCHTIGAGDLTGPDLVGTAVWPAADLTKAIRSMVEQVGALPSSEVELLLEFLQDGDRIERLRIEQERVALEQAASFEAGSVATGRELFLGTMSFANRGLACAACHAAGSNGGGVFAPDLTDAFERMGEQPLLSACEGANFPVMRATYADRPVLKQEAIHLVAYMESLVGTTDERALTGSLIITGAGLGMAALCLVAVFAVSIRKNNGVRAELVRNAIRQNRS